MGFRSLDVDFDARDPHRIGTVIDVRARLYFAKSVSMASFDSGVTRDR